MTLFLGGVLFGTASCGEDEATGGGPSTGTVGYCGPCDASSDCQSGNVCRSISGKLGVCAKASDTKCCVPGTTDCQDVLGQPVDGSGGGGGTGGIINNGGKGGTGGSGGSPQQTRLGQACVSDGDCVTEGLKCVTNTSLPGQTGPAGGLCTLPCESNGDCLDFAASAYCYVLGDQDAYCIEGCPIGETLKCHERINVACTPLTNQSPCSSNAECSPGVCDDSGICLFGGCVPTCLADSDCGSGQKCDFSTGLCSANPKEGSPIGAACDPSDDADPCAGFCVSVTETEGMCSAACSQNDSLYGCGFDGESAADAICIFASSQTFNSLGDQGICGSLCDCNDDCKISGWGCLAIDEELGPGAGDYFGRPGVCLQLDSGTKPSDTLQECPPDGSAGNGSGGESGAGSGGSAGKGGTGGTTGSSGEGGEPATNNGGAGQAGNQ